MKTPAVALPSYFGTAFVINLAERRDRRQWIEKHFARVGWTDFDFFSAVRVNDAAGFKLPSWRGCFLSHLECLKLAEAQQLRNVLIMEDDLALSPSIQRLTPELIETIESLD